MYFQVGKGANSRLLWTLLLLSAAAGTPSSAAPEDGLSLLQVQQVLNEGQGSAEGSADHTAGLLSAAAEAFYNASLADLERRGEAFSQQQAESFNQKLEELASANVTDQERGLLLVQHAIKLVEGERAASEAMVELRTALPNSCPVRMAQTFTSLGALIGHSVLAGMCIHGSGVAGCKVRYLILFQYTFLSLRGAAGIQAECNVGGKIENAMRSMCMANRYGVIGHLSGAANAGVRMSYTCQEDFSFRKLKMPRGAECIVFSTALVGVFVVNIVNFVNFLRLTAGQTLMITNKDDLLEQHALRITLQLTQFTLMLVSNCAGKGGWGTACAFDGVSMAYDLSHAYSHLRAYRDWCHDSYGNNYFRAQFLLDRSFQGKKKHGLQSAEDAQATIDRLQEILREEGEEGARKEIKQRIDQLADEQEIDRLQQILKGKDKLGATKVLEQEIEVEKEWVERLRAGRWRQMEQLFFAVELERDQRNIDRLQKILLGEDRGGARKVVEQEIDRLQKIEKKTENFWLVKQKIDRLQQNLQEEGGAMKEVEQMIERLEARIKERMEKYGWPRMEQISAGEEEPWKAGGRTRTSRKRPDKQGKQTGNMDGGGAAPSDAMGASMSEEFLD